MANAAVGDFYLLSFYHTMGAQKLINTFRYRLESLGTAITVDDVQNNMETLIASGGNILSKWLAVIPPQVTLVERWYQRVFPTRIRKKIVASGLQGTWANATTSTNQAVSIERYAENATRHGVGRIQLVASNNPLDITNGSITNAAYTTALGVLGTQMAASLTLPVVGSVLKPILQSVSVPGSFTYIIGSSVKPELRTMRRRTVGVGK